MVGAAAAVARVAIGKDDAIPHITIRILWCRIIIVVLRYMACGNTFGLNNTRGRQTYHIGRYNGEDCESQQKRGVRLPKRVKSGTDDGHRVGPLNPSKRTGSGHAEMSAL